MFTERDLERLVDSMFENAKFLLSKDKELLPVVMLLDKDLHSHVFGIAFGSRQEIRIANFLIRSKVAELSAIAVVGVTDIYRKKVQRNELDLIPEGGVKDLPGFQEAVMVQGYMVDYYYEKSESYERVQGEIVFKKDTKAHNVVPKYDRLFDNVFPIKREARVLH